MAASLIILLLTLVLVVFPVWALLKILSLGARNEELERRLRALELEFQNYRAGRVPPAPPPPAPVASEPATVTPLAPPIITGPRVAPAGSPGRTEPSTPAPAPKPTPAAAPPVIATPPVISTATAAPKPAKPRVDWEQFTGTKLLAWIGGAAAFLGAAFFLKYSFEHDLISPAARVAIGYVFAIALVLGGLRVPRQRYAVTAQTLCATGVVCLYAVTFACNAIYQFPAFTTLRTFAAMALLTAAAFVLAVRMNARVVAVLGMLGGFLTPVVLSTGRDNPAGLFGYIGLLDAGLVALALRQRWHFLVPLAAGGTVAMQIGWAIRFLSEAKAPTAMVIALVFCAQFLGAYAVARLRLAGREESDPANGQRWRAERTPFLWPAIALPCLALLFAGAFIAYPGLAARPGLLFGFVFAVDACLLAVAWLDEDAGFLHAVGGLAVFVLLAVWTGTRLTSALLPWALGLYLAHGVVHTTFPLLLERRRPGAAATAWAQWFAPLALVLMLVPLFRLRAVSFALWPCVLLLDLLAIGLAALHRSVVAAIAALVLTLVAAAVWMFRAPVTALETMPILFVIAGFAVLFFGAGLLIAGRNTLSDTSAGWRPRTPALQLPAFSALLPFLLLILMTQRPMTVSPAGIFGVALLLVLLSLALARWFRIAWLPACALAGVAALEYAWEARHPTSGLAAPAFLWYVGFHLTFSVFPFLFRAALARLTGPWAVAALAGVVQFPLVYQVVRRVAPGDYMGIVPALFALPPLASLLAIARRRDHGDDARLDQLAWYAGVGLLFVTLIFPIQFERQWITVGWALEGAALLWLFRRVPHPGLRATGVALLVGAFVRLALNPAVLSYHPRAALPILNWYLYSYGIVSVCLFAGAALLPPGRERMRGIPAPPLLNALGVILAFLLLNIEIADFFSEPGAPVLTFEFSGHFGRDMTYTIAWALFALVLLLVGISKRIRAGRRAALALLGVTVLKLFLHDLARLDALYRIGALFAVSIIAIAASIAYQRFLPPERRDR